MKHDPSNFYFELSANGEHTRFNAVDGVSTTVTLPGNLSQGDNPYKYRMPSLPKSRHLVLKHGESSDSSKLMQWCAQCENPEAAPERSKAMLTLKDSAGKPLVEWTLYNAYPQQSKSVKPNPKSANRTIEDLQLGYSFYTLNRK